MTSVLSREAARQYWPGQNPIGQRIAYADARTEWIEVVGITGDVCVAGIFRGETLHGVPVLRYGRRGLQHGEPFLRTTINPGGGIFLAQAFESGDSPSLVAAANESVGCLEFVFPDRERARHDASRIFGSDVDGNLVEDGRM